MKSWRWFLVGSLILSFSLEAHSAIPDLNLKRIDARKTLIGQEHTAQDQEMIDEPGRASPPTEHRWEKLRAFVEAFKVRMKVTAKKAVRERNNNLDPGFYVKIRKRGEYRVNMEPVTIEVNSPPPNIFQLRRYATPIYEVYEQIGLVPYVNPAGERSGMGHAHIGGATLQESPFYLFPNLLPNLLVYLHNNPAALFALSEAYDMGKDSNMETYHYGPKQVEFSAAIEEYHKWWEENPRRRIKEGLARFVKIIGKTSLQPTEHYRYVNFERLAGLGTSKESLRAQLELKARTVEVRVIRPYRTVDHAEAVGFYLLKLLDYLSRPGMLLKVQPVTRESFQYYYSGTEIATNWLQVKKDLGFENPLVEEMVQEYVDNVRLKTYATQGLPQGAEMSAAYSRKEDKGKRYEIRIPMRNDRELAPIVSLNKLQIPFKKINFRGQNFWVGMFHTADHKVEKSEMQEGKAVFAFGVEAAQFPVRQMKSDRAPKHVPPPPPVPKPPVAGDVVVIADRKQQSDLPEMKMSQAVEILSKKESNPEDTKKALKAFKKHAELVTHEFFEFQLTDEFAMRLIRSDYIFAKMKGYFHFFGKPDFKPSTEDLRAISKALDNSSFNDRQVVFSRIAAKWLYLHRTDSYTVESELRKTVQMDSDIATRSFALAAFIANGESKLPNTREEIERAVRELRAQRAKPQIVGTTSLIEFFLQAYPDKKPNVLSQGSAFSCEAVF